MQVAARGEEAYFDGAGGQRLFERVWSHDGPPKAVVVIVHGYAEHSGRYAYVGEQLVARGYSVRAYDLRGHGHSGGPRTHIRSAAEHLSDLDVVLHRACQAHPGRRVFLLGHSMGGGIVALAASVGRAPVDGIILSGATLPAGDGRGGIMQRLLRIVGRIAPRLPLIKLKAADVSRDPEIVRLYDADPLNYRGRMSAGLIAALIRAAARIATDSPSIATPLLVLHGGADALTDPEGSRRLYERVASSDKTIRIYDGLYHEILNEPERDQVIADIVAWLDHRVS